MDLTNEMKLIQSEQKKEVSLIQRLFVMCTKSSKLSRPSLLTERDQLLALAKVRFDDKEPSHFRMIYTIFT